jgi:hypothetical protein
VALTITDAGNGVSTTSTATVATGATVTASIGDMLVAIIAADNAGAAGVASLTSVTDSAGNTWTQRAKINFTPSSAALDGATLGIYTCSVTNALASGTVTANFNPNTPSKAIQVYRIQPGAGEAVQFLAADAAGSTGNTSTHSAPTVPVTNGDTIFGAAAIETNPAVTGDGDTTNGSWSSILTRLASNGGLSMTNSSQWKTVNATGNQSWAASTVSTLDSARSYLIIGPLILPAAPAYNPNPFLSFLVR